MDHVRITRWLSRTAENSRAPDGRLLDLNTGLPCSLAQQSAWATSYAMLRAWRRYLSGQPVPGWLGRWCKTMDLFCAGSP